MGVATLSSRVQLPNGFIDITAIDYGSIIRIYIESGGGLFYEFSASEHIHKRHMIEFGLVNGTDPWARTIESGGRQYTILFPALTFTHQHGAEIEFKRHPVDLNIKNSALFHPLQNPAIAPNAGQPLEIKEHKPVYSTQGLNNAPMSYDDGTYVLGPVNQLMRTGPAWNGQAGKSNQWFSRSRNSMVVSSNKLAPNMGNMSRWQGNRMGFFYHERAGSGAWDAGSDVDTTIWSNKNYAGPKRFYEENLDYESYHACTTSVNGVGLVVATDVKGDFYIHKVADEGDAPDYIKVEPPYPSWVTSHTYMSRWEWNFNSTGTKVVGVPVNSVKDSTTSWQYMEHRLEGEGGTSCALKYPHPPEKWDIEDYEWYTDPIYQTYQRIMWTRDNTPGLVEFAIHIEVNDDGELTGASLALLQDDWFKSSGTYYIAADYEYNTDALITQTLEAYTDVPLTVPDNYTGDYMDFYAINNDDGNEDFMWWAPSNTNPETTAPRLDVIWKLNRDGVVVSEECLVRDFPIIKAHRDQSGLGPIGEEICGDTFTARIYDVYRVCQHGYFDPGDYFKYSQCITACDMRSVSYTVLSLGYDDKTHKLYANGHLLKTVNTGTTEVDVSDKPTHTVKVPYADIYAYWYSFQSFNSHFSGIHSHPEGHLAVCATDYYGPDAPCNDPYSYNAGPRTIPLVMLDYIRCADGSEGTHKDLFNETFAQTRDYDYYYQPQNMEENWLEPPNYQQAVDIGSFCTQGIWRTFK